MNREFKYKRINPLICDLDTHNKISDSELLEYVKTHLPLYVHLLVPIPTLSAALISEGGDGSFARTIRMVMCLKKNHETQGHEGSFKECQLCYWIDDGQK